MVMISLVTGANGFVGSHLVRYLVEQGDDVRAMVRKTSNLQLLQGIDPNYVYADVTDPHSLVEAVDGTDVVYHVAGAIAGRTQADFDRVNADGTKQLVAAVQAARQRPRRVVLVSSIAAGGPSSPDTPRHEDDEPAPVSMYGVSKLRGEEALCGLPDDVQRVIVRPPIVYGSGDTATLDLYQTARRGFIGRVTGQPRPVSFVHVADLVRGMRMAALDDRAAGHCFYLCGPDDGTTYDMQLAIAAAMQAQPRTIPIPMWLLSLAGWIADRIASLTGRPKPFSGDKVAEARQAAWLANREKARALLNFEGEIAFPEGVAEALAWYERKGWL